MKGIFSVIVNLITVMSLWAGIFQGHENALNIGLFFVWLGSISSLTAVSDAAKKPVSEISKVRISIGISCDIIAIYILAWDGWFVTATACVIGALFLYAGWKKAREEQASDAQ